MANPESVKSLFTSLKQTENSYNLCKKREIKDYSTGVQSFSLLCVMSGHTQRDAVLFSVVFNLILESNLISCVQNQHFLTVEGPNYPFQAQISKIFLFHSDQTVNI